MSEAIRRAVIRQRDDVLGLSLPARLARLERLQKLFDLFEQHNAEDEIRELKAQDEGF